MKTLIIALLIGCSLFVNELAAQDKTHTVVAKENYYSIARLYNLSPKEIAAYNNLNMEAGLQIGQKIKIPAPGQVTLPAAPTSSVVKPTIVAPPKPTTAVVAPAENNVPMRHVVAQGETLFRISKNFNVDVNDVKQWNNLSSDDVKIGQTLIINKGVKSEVGVGQVTSQTTVATTKAQVPVAATTAPPKKVTEDTALVYISPVETKVEEPKKDENVQKAVGIRSAGYSQAPPVKQPVAESIKAESIVVSSTKTQTTAPSKAVVYEAGESNAPVEGAFSSVFTKGKNANNFSGEAATFKSTSGWQDNKYYVLINDVAPGTILKIATSEKVVYAKVLGNMPEMKENNGLLLRISNAAAAHLGIVDPKFPVQVTYY